ncbi:MAG: fructose-bisphosphate aldolase [Nanoarchaeota archaeon]|nr:fructose-bisphosphate aldolase [Nanoarchaeota archaeon]
MTYMKDVEKTMKRLETKGKTLFLAQDQGLEHGPWELKDNTIDPDYIFNIAEKGAFDGFICQKGLAEKYAASYKTNVILKVNGKDIIGHKKDDPYSPITCSVKKAVELGADAIGFTNFPGSNYEAKIFEDFTKIQEDAHDYGLPVTSWMYPRGEAIKNDIDRETLAYAARIGLELGADYLKMKYNGNMDDMKYQIRAGGKAKMLMAGGPKTSGSKEFLKQVEEVDSCGAQGFAIGRNIWLHENPIAMSKAIRDIQIEKKHVFDALKRLEK